MSYFLKQKKTETCQAVLWELILNFSVCATVDGVMASTKALCLITTSRQFARVAKGGGLKIH